MGRYILLVEPTTDNTWALYVAERTPVALQHLVHRRERRKRSRLVRLWGPSLVRGGLRLRCERLRRVSLLRRVVWMLRRRGLRVVLLRRRESLRRLLRLRLRLLLLLLRGWSVAALLLIGLRLRMRERWRGVIVGLVLRGIRRVLHSHHRRGLLERLRRRQHSRLDVSRRTQLRCARLIGGNR